MELLAKLVEWRNMEAQKRGVEHFRILPDKTLKEIAGRRPETKQDLCSIPGIKELKYMQFGKTILNIVSGGCSTESFPTATEQPCERVYTVGEYIDIVNIRISQIRAKIQGEVVAVQFRGSGVYFSLQEKDMSATIAVFMWHDAYILSGIELAAGMEIIVSGITEIYKKFGKLNFRCDGIELSGEGQIRASYMELKRKLEKEGLFLPEHKTRLSFPPKSIVLITSKTGAVIHDFMNNLAQRGMKISLIDTKMEGVTAVRDILAAIKKANTLLPDGIVLIRGGGSLESLQPFNNEHVVRAVYHSRVPVLCAIGHDSDTPLAQLAADMSYSTPSLVATSINTIWSEAERFFVSTMKHVSERMRDALASHKHTLHLRTFDLLHILSQPNKKILAEKERLYLYVQQISLRHVREQSLLLSIQQKLTERVHAQREHVQQSIIHAERLLEAHDPVAILKKGFSLTFHHDKIVTNIAQITVGSPLQTTLRDGVIYSTVTHKE